LVSRHDETLRNKLIKNLFSAFKFAPHPSRGLDS
jgi:hypothetical protein